MTSSSPASDFAYSLLYTSIPDAFACFAYNFTVCIWFTGVSAVLTNIVSKRPDIHSIWWAGGQKGWVAADSELLYIAWMPLVHFRSLELSLNLRGFRTRLTCWDLWAREHTLYETLCFRQVASLRSSFCLGLFGFWPPPPLRPLKWSRLFLKNLSHCPLDLPPTPAASFPAL